MRLLVIAVFTLIPQVVVAAERVPSTGTEDPRFEPIDKLMTTFLEEHKLSGAAVAIARHGHVVYTRGFGYADLETKEPVQPGSLFRIASISKPITAAAVLQLVDQGKLKLDERVFDVLQLKTPSEPKVEFDARWKKVTIDHLLHHTGGWDRGKSFDPMFVSPKVVEELHVPAPASPDAIIRYMLRRPLQTEPGTEYAYSNFGYCLLGRVIEKRGGMGYEKYVKEKVLAPLGATHMQIGHSLLSGRVKNEVKYYTPNKEPTATAIMGPEIGKPVPWQYGGWCLESMDSHGGWIAPVADLARFASAFEDPARCKILSKAEVTRMFAPPAGTLGTKDDGTPKDRYYGCGWQVVRVGGGKFNYFHTGSLDGTSTILVHRHDGLSWAILFNSRAVKTAPSGLIDPLMHKAVNEVKEWPRTE
jgi:N-acyl-D-amino-acid deacylase